MSWSTQVPTSEQTQDQTENAELPSILAAGDPILRTRAESVERAEIKSPEIQDIISTMVKVMRKQSLVGMAASQIGVLKRIIVLEDREEYIAAALSQQEREQRQRYLFPLKIIINPKLTFFDTQSPATMVFPERSPVVQGYQGSVERYLEVKVEGLDENGDPFEWQPRGWPARILQHEVDHLDGILYIDRMDSKTFKSIPAS